MHGYVVLRTTTQYDKTFLKHLTLQLMINPFSPVFLAGYKPVDEEASDGSADSELACELLHDYLNGVAWDLLGKMLLCACQFILRATHHMY